MWDDIYDIKDIIDMIRLTQNNAGSCLIRLHNKLHFPNKKLINNFAIRYVTNAMLSCALKFKELIYIFQCGNSCYRTCQNEEEWKKLKEACSFREMFNQAIEYMYSWKITYYLSFQF